MTQKNDSDSKSGKNSWVILIFVLSLSFLILLGYKFGYDLLDWVFMNSDEKQLRNAMVGTGADGKITLAEKTVALSNIRRNYALLFFAVFAGGLAIWARFNHEKQLKHAEIQIEQTETQIEQTEKQLKQTKDQINQTRDQIVDTRKQLNHAEKQAKNSLTVNRNERYAKAVEMLEKDGSIISNRSGLYMLRDLINEADEIESIRYIEIIADWLRLRERPSELVKLANDILG